MKYSKIGTNIIFILKEEFLKQKFKNFILYKKNEIKKFISKFFIEFKNILSINNKVYTNFLIKKNLKIKKNNIIKKNILGLIKKFSIKHYIIFLNNYLIYTNLQQNIQTNVILLKINNKIKLNLIFSNYKNYNNFFYHLSNSFLDKNILVNINKIENNKEIFFFTCVTLKKNSYVFTTNFIFKYHIAITANITHINIHDITKYYFKINNIYFYLEEISNCSYNFIENITKNSLMNVNLNLIQKKSSIFTAFFISKSNMYTRMYYDIKKIGTFAKNEINSLIYLKKKDVFELVYYSELSKKNSQAIFNLYTLVKNNSKFYFDGLIKINKKVKNALANLIYEGITLGKNVTLVLAPKLDIQVDNALSKHSISIYNVLDNDKLFYTQSRGLTKNFFKKFLSKNFISTQLEKYLKNINLINYIKKYFQI